MCSIQEICTTFGITDKREETLHIIEESLHKCGLCLSTLSNAGHISCQINFLCPDTMLSIYILLPHSVTLSFTDCYVFIEQEHKSFDAKYCYGMNTSSACKFKSPSKQGNLGSTVMAKQEKYITQGRNYFCSYFCIVAHDSL